nr:MAG TPA: hypothetical protein [Caudoviricetes sp.]
MKLSILVGSFLTSFSCLKSARFFVLLAICKP